MKRIRFWQLAIIALVVVLIMATAGFVIWGSNPLPAHPEAYFSIESNDSISVEQEPWLVFKPGKSIPTTGFIFYPGGRVQPLAYAPAARAIAEEGYLVVIPSMPLNLAIFASDVADEITATFPEIDCWIIGGHSLGGAMAARFANRNPHTVQGLVLWAAYPAESDDLSSNNLEVASIYASKDGVADVDTVLASQPLLPASTSWVLIEGGNHAGFGYYGPQSGDGTRTISLEEQQEQIITGTVELLDKTCD